jgi:hypothetical protein
MPYWLGLCVLRRTCRQNRLYETLFHTVIILNKHHQHHHHHYIPLWRPREAAISSRVACNKLAYTYTYIYLHVYIYMYIYVHI